MSTPPPRGSATGQPPWRAGSPEGHSGAPRQRSGARLQAVALEYGLNPAPVVVARGEGELAQAIIRRAQEQGIWIAQDAQLVALLSRVDLEQEIPPELYTAVAVILSWVYWLRGMQPGDEKPEAL